jgi:hypothetical protein
MGTLSSTWFAEGYIDFELKKYTLLAYLQEIHQHFDQQKLYPQLADVIMHYNNLLALKNNKGFPATTISTQTGSTGFAATGSFVSEHH